MGLHAVLVGEDPPLLSAPEIPTLVGYRGHLASSWRTFVPRLVAGRVDPADIRRAIAAQLAFVRSGAGPVTHINLHQHLHMWPTVRTTVLDLAGAEGIGYVRTPSSARLGPFGAAIRRLARATAAHVASRGLATSDGFLGLDEAGRWDSASLAVAIAHSGSAVVELNAHPGPAFDPHRARYAWQYQWGAEFDARSDPGTRGIIGRVGFRLVGPSQIEATVPAPAS